jgi:hypothetical protein
MKKQLLIAYSFPPISNAESIVTSNMVRALENWGWKTVVCTSKPESDHQGGGYDLMSLLPQSSEIIRSNTLPGKKITRLLRVLKLTKIAKLVSSLPDDGIFWYPTALCSFINAGRKRRR